MKLRNRHIAALVFLSATPTICLFSRALYIRYYSVEFFLMRFYSVLDCLFGLHIAVEKTQFYCSIASHYLLIRDLVFFFFYPLSVLLFLGLCMLAMKRFLSDAGEWRQALTIGD